MHGQSLTNFLVNMKSTKFYSIRPHTPFYDSCIILLTDKLEQNIFSLIYVMIKYVISTALHFQE